MDMVEKELATVERAAAAVAEPTPHAADTIAALKTGGKRVGIVSNNSLSAVQFYVTKHHLSEHVDGIGARTESDPSLLKPAPHIVDQVLRDMGADRTKAVLIGDQTSDIEAAHAAGISGIGYANKPGKFQRLEEVGADAVITDMRQAAPSLTLQRGARRPETPDELSI
jgi:HAD superfamily hydrolase (TIGR01549 family)